MVTRIGKAFIFLSLSIIQTPGMVKTTPAETIAPEAIMVSVTAISSLELSLIFPIMIMDNMVPNKIGHGMVPILRAMNMDEDVIRAIPKRPTTILLSFIFVSGILFMGAKAPWSYFCFFIIV